MHLHFLGILCFSDEWKIIFHHWGSLKKKKKNESRLVNPVSCLVSTRGISVSSHPYYIPKVLLTFSGRWEYISSVPPLLGSQKSSVYALAATLKGLRS